MGDSQKNKKMELCASCGSARDPELLFSFSPEGRPFCQKCFATAIEKRMRAAARTIGISKWKEVRYEDDNSAAAAATAYVLGRMFKDSRKKITRLKPGKRGKQGAPCLLPLSIEEAAADGISFFFGKKGDISLPPSISSAATMKELEHLCAIKMLEFTRRETISNSFLESIHLKNPHSYNGVMSSILQLSNADTWRKGTKNKKS